MNTKALRFALVALAISVAVASDASVAESERFSFIAMGCMPYGPQDFAAYERLLKEINRHQPAFTVHCGDTKKSSVPPSEENLAQVKTWFDSLDGPLIYTPGDNEWTDVHAVSAGREDPLKWLEKIRALYFPEERSMGRAPIPLVTQRRDPRFAKFVENARWSRGGVVFATVHVVGSSNNRLPAVAGAMEEFAERDAATLAWMRETFAEARATEAAGVGLFFQANVFHSNGYGRADENSGFKQFLAVLEEEARAFTKPVLLVYADEHRYRFEQGVRFREGAEALQNVSRLETFGASDIHAVMVTVDTGSKQVFLAGPLLVPGNALPVLPR